MSRSLRRDVGHVLAADPHRAVEQLLEAREHPQRRRLPRAGRPDEDHQLAVVDLEVEGVDRRHRCPGRRPSPPRSGPQPSCRAPPPAEPRARAAPGAPAGARQPVGPRVRAACPAAVEGEQRGADDRRVGGEPDLRARRDRREPALDRRGEMAVLRAQQPAAEHDVDRLGSARAARARRARTPRPRRASRSLISPATASSAAAREHDRRELDEAPAGEPLLVDRLADLGRPRQAEVLAATARSSAVRGPRPSALGRPPRARRGRRRSRRPSRP